MHQSKLLVCKNILGNKPDFDSHFCHLNMRMFLENKWSPCTQSLNGYLNIIERTFVKMLFCMIFIQAATLSYCTDIFSFTSRSVWSPSQHTAPTQRALRWPAWRFRWWKWTKTATSTYHTSRRWWEPHYCIPLVSQMMFNLHVTRRESSCIRACVYIAFLFGREERS